MSWSAEQYVKFEDERTRPVRDLLAAVPGVYARSVVDIGCGPGNSTEVLVARFPNAVATGMDSSEDMIKAARKRLPDVTFEVADIASWNAKGPYDVILANAVIQWLPDHATLLPSLVSRLAVGGSLAIQIPNNLDQPTHRLMREIAADGPWAAKLTGSAARRAPRQSAEWYYRTLRPISAKTDVWQTTYYHPLADGAEGVVEWLKGTGLRPFLDPLDETERAAFLERYTKAVAQAYPALPDGTVLLPFPRLFMVATL
ncbi:trans-aconitate 2-methyltransferase [Phyllobacterium sp. 628]|nr:trans-aconitate 2-methyltransferase [Phyllobacterium sp. 628]